MIASRSQILEEAWNGLWCAQEPYVVPAIPLIGFEMSNVNGGRMMLLGKMHNEINTLQELGNQLCHYIDVNYSLVEELRMEGIERLATNKLLLVEVEREVTRRITHICSNKSVRDLSSMHQFLFQLRPPTSTGMPSTADESMDHVDSTTNGSCSTQKVTTEGSSEALQRSLDTVSKDVDAVSPDSQSFVSKCFVTQGENMHSPSNIRHIGLLSTKMLNCRQPPSDLVATPEKDIPLGTSVLASALDIKLYVRNHSSSASEERLPKVLQAGNGQDDLAQGVGSLIEKHEHNNEPGAVKQVEEPRSRTFVVDAGKQLAVNSTRLHFSEAGKVYSSAGKEVGLEVELTQEAAQVDFMVHSDSNMLPSNISNLKVAELSAGQGFCKPLEMDQMSKIYNRDSQSAPLDFSGKRQADCASFLDGSSGETMDLVARKFKRAKVQASFEVMKAGAHASKDSLMTQSMHSKQGLCSNGSDDRTAEDEQMGSMIPRRLESPFIPCSCDRQMIDSIDIRSASDSKASVHCRCKECGGFFSPSLTQQVDQNSLKQDPTNVDHVIESPILATQ